MKRSKWPGFRDDGLALPLPPAWFNPVATRLEWGDDVLEAKPEFHVTLLDQSSGAAVREALGTERVREMFEGAGGWDPASTGEGVLVRKQARQRTGTTASIIERVALPALHRFRAEVARAAGIELARAPAHVTLYTAGDTQGIGLDSEQELEDATVARFRLPGIANRPAPRLDDAQKAAYCAADYALDAFDTHVRIGEHCRFLDAQLERRDAARATIVTAFNPFSAACAEAGNELRQQWLQAVLRNQGLDFVDAEGRDPDGAWSPEPSLLVFGTTPALEHTLLRDFEQHAVVAIERGARAALVLHPDQAG